MEAAVKESLVRRNFAQTYDSDIFGGSSYCRLPTASFWLDQLPSKISNHNFIDLRYFETEPRLAVGQP